ncbi:unnamed protein product, partial [Discosporangium mesarthrocarpum]
MRWVEKCPILGPRLKALREQPAEGAEWVPLPRPRSNTMGTAPCLPRCST